MSAALLRPEPDPEPAHLAAPTQAADALAWLAANEAAGRTGDHVQGAACARRAAEAATAVGDKTTAARAQAALALHLARLNECEGAIRAGLLALDHFVFEGSLPAQSQVHSTLALAYDLAGLGQQALTHAVAALDAARACGDRQAECWALNRVGMVQEGVDDGSASRRYMRQALALARELDGPDEIFACLNNLASGALARAQAQGAKNQDQRFTLQQALGDAQDAVQAAQTQGNAHRLMLSTLNLGCVLAGLGLHDEALRHFETCRGLAVEANNLAELPFLELEVARVERAQGLVAQAIARLQKVLPRDGLQAQTPLRRDVHQALYEWLKEVGDSAGALAHLESFHALAMQASEVRSDLQSRILINRLELDQARHNADRARLEADMQRLRAEELDRAAHHDALTGLYNRRFMDSQLPRLVQRAQERALPLAMAVLDIDHFKHVNDKHGHAMGDRVLAEVARLLRLTVRGSDLPIRFGGEEFVIVLVDTSMERAHEVCERLRQAVQQHDWASLHADLRVTLSAGLSVWCEAETPAQWLARADGALYGAKHAGRNQVMQALDAG
jgi:diguanylate cyclase (GGDEF)-like protein